MTEYVGSELHVSFGGTALQGNFRTFSIDESVDLVDASAGGDLAKSYLRALEDGTATIELVDTRLGTTTWAALRKGASGTLEWGTEGTATGRPRSRVVAFVRARRRSQPYNDVAVISADFQFSGTISDLVW